MITVAAGPPSTLRKDGPPDANNRLDRQHPNPNLLLQIGIYYDDHGVPHFHAVSPSFDVKIAIADGGVISASGRLRGRDLAAIRAWGQIHRGALYEAWNCARAGEPLQFIKD
jgi:hypothetical protein